MTNEALQNLIGSWFPNPEAKEAISETKENLEKAEVSEEITDRCGCGGWKSTPPETGARTPSKRPKSSGTARSGRSLHPAC